MWRCVWHVGIAVSLVIVVDVSHVIRRPGGLSQGLRVYVMQGSMMMAPTCYVRVVILNVLHA